MKVVQVSFFYDEDIATADQLLQRHYTTTCWAEALQRQQAEVTVINRFHQEAEFVQNKVRHLFVKDGCGGRFSGWHIPYQFLKRISRLDADVIHLHHLTLSIQTVILRMMLPSKTAIIVQDHGGKPPGRLKRFVHTFLNRVVDGFFFTTNVQGKQWLLNKSAERKIMPVMEGGTTFKNLPKVMDAATSFQRRAIAKDITGMHGGPVFLWVGRLDNNKDPLTILDAFEEIIEDYPSAVLYMAFGEGELIQQVKEKIAVSKQLCASVKLLGKLAHEHMPSLYESADYFLLGSHQEGSGYALSEALRFGCVPVVTNIPPFEMMTSNGEFGALWEAGNKNSLIAAIKMIVKKPLADESRKCVAFYHANLSYDAIATIAVSHYQQVIMKRQIK